jgi:hypothetical protein
MSDRKWACRIGCDWVGCIAETDVTLDSIGSDHHQLPEGWVDLEMHLFFLDTFNEKKKIFCPEHSRCTIADLAAAPWREFITKAIQR